MFIRTVAAIATATIATFAHAAGPTAYSVVELPAIGNSGLCTGRPVALSPTSGLALGYSCLPNWVSTVPALWSSSGIRRLRVPPSYAAQVNAVNDRGQSAGFVEDENLATNAVIWSPDGAIRRLPPTVEGNTTTVGGISARGDVGGLEINRRDGRWIPVVWRLRQASVLPVPASLKGAQVRAVSPGGLMAGSGLTNEGGSSAVVWRDGAATIVGPVGGYATGVNDAGQVVGEYRPSPGVDGAFLATETSTTILPMSGASAINRSGVIVGHIGGRASRWISGVHELLDDLLDANARTEQWSIYYAGSIDDEGRIVAAASRPESPWTSVLLIPVKN